MFFQKYIPVKIFIFGIDYMEKIMGQTIHQKAKRCLVRFADGMLFALITSKGLHMWLIDFVGAYLNLKPQGENYLEIPEGFEGHYNIPGVNTVLIMNLTIYGTMDGANNWFQELISTFTKLGHCQSHANPCIHIQWTDDGYTITGTYTDDVSGGSSSMKTETQTKSELGDNYEITNLG